jgi:lipoic acid synthetase
MSEAARVRERKPPWLKVRLPSGEKYFALRARVRQLRLNTVCEESLCPNIAECWGRGTCTIMILGDTCTRACGFCAVKAGRPSGTDLLEPARVAKAVAESGWSYVVVTSVARDDLADGGASIFAETIRRIRTEAPGTRIEVLIPDFQASESSLRSVIEARPDVLAHNIEVVRRLQRSVRSRSSYETSLGVLRLTKLLEPSQLTKTSLQVGHGENEAEILELFEDLAAIRVDVLTIGQYLKPSDSARHREVERYATPEDFERLADEARRRGIPFVFAGPLVRSSYKAEQVFAGTAGADGPERT